VIPYYRKKGYGVDEPVNQEAIRVIEAKLGRVLEAYPELLEVNSERQKALEEWLEGLGEGEVEDGVQEDR
jgi:hypothetical protein